MLIDNILVVDDDENVLQGLERNLKILKTGYNFFFCNDAKSALEIMDKNAIQLVVSDYKMPGMDGIELLQRVKAKDLSIKRILLTGQSEEEIFEKAKGVADKYLSKPCDAKKLMAIINVIKELS